MSYHINVHHPNANLQLELQAVGNPHEGQDAGDPLPGNQIAEVADSLAGCFDAARQGRRFQSSPRNETELSDGVELTDDVVLAPDDSDEEAANQIIFDWRDHVLEPDCIGVPECVSKLFFKPPEDFGNRFLIQKVGTRDSVKFGNDVGANLTDELLSGVDLLHILKGHKLSLFDKVMKWKHGDGEQPFSRDKLLKDLQTIYAWLRPSVSKEGHRNYSAQHRSNSEVNCIPLWSNVVVSVNRPSCNAAGKPFVRLRQTIQQACVWWE